jgi:hypothetical protein
MRDKEQRDQAAQLLDDFDEDRIDGDELKEGAARLGWDEDDYFAMCRYSGCDDAWYPRTELGTPADDYSVLDHCSDFLRDIVAEGASGP